MRDALSIMDQAIACCGQSVDGASLRQLVGVVPSDIFEQMLAAVRADSSEAMLRLVDRLIAEGHNPVHLSRQMLRFLRNVLVAKVAGGDSALLQISSDERVRASRVAEPFAEEDLARFLQILLRTHSELGYKQEQRFHLELGLLKMVHAQRLLPLEEFLSGANLSNTGSAGGAAGGGGTHGQGQGSTARRVGTAPRTAVSPPPTASPAAGLRPDSGGPRSEAPVAAHAATTSAAAAPAVESPAGAVELTPLQLAETIIAAAESGCYYDLGNMLRNGQWSLQGSEIVAQVPDSPVLVRMAFKKEAEQVLNAAATALLGRPARVKVVCGGNGEAPPPVAARVASSPARARVANEPVIQRLQEKFGAEIRSVIDYREQG